MERHSANPGVGCQTMSVGGAFAGLTPIPDSGRDRSVAGTHRCSGGSPPPVAGAPSAVSHRHDHNPRIVDAVDERVRVSAYKHSPVAPVEGRPAFWSLADDAQGSVDFGVKTCCNRQAALPVPLRRFEKIPDGPRVEDDTTAGHVAVS